MTRSKSSMYVMQIPEKEDERETVNGSKLPKFSERQIYRLKRFNDINMKKIMTSHITVKWLKPKIKGKY